MTPCNVLREILREGREERLVLEPESGAVVRLAGSNDREEIVGMRRPPWGTAIPTRGRRRSRIRSNETGEFVGDEFEGLPVVLSEMGKVLVLDATGALVHADAVTGHRRVVATGVERDEFSWHHVSPSGRHIAIGRPGDMGRRIVNLETFERVAAPVAEGWRVFSWFRTSDGTDALWCMRGTENERGVLFAASGRVTPLSPDEVSSAYSCAPMADGTVIVAAKHELLWIDRDGSVKKRLYGPRGE